MAYNKDFIVKNGVQVLGSTQSTSTDSGALQVHGGAGIGGNLHVGNAFFVGDPNQWNTISVDPDVGIAQIRNGWTSTQTYNLTAGVDYTTATWTTTLPFWWTHPTTAVIKVQPEMGLTPEAQEALLNLGNDQRQLTIGVPVSITTSGGVTTVLVYTSQSAGGGEQYYGTYQAPPTGPLNVTSLEFTAVLNNYNTIYLSSGGIQIEALAPLQIYSTLTQFGQAGSVVEILSAINSTSPTTGALQVTGGVGVGGDIRAGGNVGIGANPPSTSQLSIDGDATNNQQLFIRNNSSNVNAKGYLTLSNAGAGLDFGLYGYAHATLADFGYINYPASGGFLFTSSNSEVIRIGSTGDIKISSITSATSTNSGALQVVGGAGVGGKVWAEQLHQTSNEIAIGGNAGLSGQGSSATAVGDSAGQINQGSTSVAIGAAAGYTGQGVQAVAVGLNAGYQDQGVDAVAIGNGAGNNTQSLEAVAIGLSAGQTTQGGSAVAIGPNAGSLNQGFDSVAIGDSAGTLNQGYSAVAVGPGAGNTTQGQSAIAVGLNAGYITQGTYAVAIGDSAGQNTQSNWAIAIGIQAGNLTQGESAIAIGEVAGQNTQSYAAISIGLGAGQYSQGVGSLAIGVYAGNETQGNTSLAIGESAGRYSQGTEALAVGLNAGNSYQSAFATALGRLAGNETQGESAVAVGDQAGQTTQGQYAVAVGQQAGKTVQGQYAVALGWYAGRDTQSDSAVAIGSGAGNTTQGTRAIAIGFQAGQLTQGNSAIAVGSNAGVSNQGSESIAVGGGAGYDHQGIVAVAIGADAGNTSQGNYAVAIGSEAAVENQGAGAVAVGDQAGTGNQGTWAVAVGYLAGGTNQGARSIAIGARAGENNQHTGSVIISALGTTLNTVNTGTFIAPIRTDASTSATQWTLFYNPTTKELTTASGYTTSTLVANAVSAITATSAAIAYSLANTGTTRVGFADTANNWLGGIVPNSVTFSNNVTFSGSATYINSTATVYTDNILELHTPPGGMDAEWTVDDGKDVGFHLHYFKNGTDTNAALLLRNDSKYLEWFQSGTDLTSNGNNFTATTYGTFKTGNIILANTTASYSTTTGALTVAGGVGVGGSIYVASTVTASYFYTPDGVAGLPSSSYDISGSRINATTGMNIGGPGGAGLSFGDNYYPSVIYGSPDYINAYTHNNSTDRQLWYGNENGLVVGNGDTPTAKLEVRGTAIITGTTIISSAENSTSTTTGALTVVGGVGIQGDLFVGATGYVQGAVIITTATFNTALGTALETKTFTATYITQTPGSVPVPAVGTTTTYGTYNFGSLTDITTYGDYNVSAQTGYYSVNDATGAPAFVTYIGFENVVEFNRAVFNINYTTASGHTVDIDLYNYDNNAWDTFAVYSGSGNWQQFALGLVDHLPYISAANSVTTRIYHVSSGNTSHRTWIDYVALEQSTTGGQGPRGATGATGATGAQGVNTGTTSTFIISNTAGTTSTTTGALQVAGGVGVGGGLYIGGASTFTNAVTIGNSGLTVGGPTALASATSGNVVSFGNTFSSGGVLYSNGGTVGVISQFTTTDLILSTNVNGGAFGAITKGIKIVGATGDVIVQNTSSSTSTTTGALVVTGGVGVGGNLNVGGTVTVVQPIISNPAAISVGTSIIVLDSFDMTKYRAAKYFITVSNGSTLQYQATDILLIQDGNTASIEQTSVFATTDNILTFSATIIGGIVYLRGIGTSANNAVKIQATYITI